MAKTYDPKKIIVTFKGTVISGFAAGTFVAVAPAGDVFTKVVGADGEVARGRSNDDTAEVTITLMQTSNSNAYLSKVMAQDKIDGSGVGPLQVMDVSGNTVYFWPEAWIKKSPGGEFGKELGDRAWVFDTGQIKEETIY